MSRDKIIHPNFRIGPGQKDIANRARSIMFSTSQNAFDAIMAEIDHGRAKDSREVIARAIEKHLDLQPGTADPNTSESE